MALLSRRASSSSSSRVASGTSRCGECPAPGTIRYSISRGVLADLVAVGRLEHRVDRGVAAEHQGRDRDAAGGVAQVPAAGVGRRYARTASGSTSAIAASFAVDVALVPVRLRGAQGLAGQSQLRCAGRRRPRQLVGGDVPDRVEQHEPPRPPGIVGGDRRSTTLPPRECPMTRSYGPAAVARDIGDVRVERRIRARGRAAVAEQRDGRRSPSRRPRATRARATSRRGRSSGRGRGVRASRPRPRRAAAPPRRSSGRRRIRAAGSTAGCSPGRGRGRRGRGRPPRPPRHPGSCRAARRPSAPGTGSMTLRTSAKIGPIMSDTSGSVTASPQSWTSRRGSRTSLVSPVIMRRSMALGGGSSPSSRSRSANSDHPVAQDALSDGERDLLLAVEVQVDGAGRHARPRR